MSRWHTTEFDLLPEQAFRPRGGKGKFSGGMTLEGGGKSAPQPSPKMEEAATRQIQLAEDQWADYIGPGGDREWMRALADEAMGISRSTAERSNALSDYQLGMMQFSDDRYRNNTIPYQDMVDSEIDRLYSREGIENQVNMAVADVSGATANARGQGLRAMNRMGVNPMSGAYGEGNNAMSVQQAQAMASAANKTRTAAEQAGLASRFQSLGAKLGIAGLGAANAGLATSALGTGLNAANLMTGAGAASINANNQTFNTAMSGMSAGVNGLGNYTNLGIRSAEVNAQNDPFRMMLGAATGVATSKYLS
jgi:hypothetical protein